MKTFFKTLLSALPVFFISSYIKKNNPDQPYQ